MEKRLQVLIVEDDFNIACALAGSIQSIGYRVCGMAANKADAIDFASDRQPDLMIVDAGLDEGNGVSAAAAILSKRYVAHVFVTGDSARVSATFPDAVILQKPYFVRDLHGAIAQALAQGRPDKAVPCDGGGRQSGSPDCRVVG